MPDLKLQEKNTLYAPAFSNDWSEQSLYPLADWLNGMAFKDFEFAPKGKPVIKIAEIKNGISGQTRFTNEEYGNKYLLKKGDMLFCWSGQPQTSIDVFWWNGPEGWLNQHIFKVTSKLENRYFFFYLLKYLKPNFVQIAINKQTTGLGHVTKGDLDRFIVKLPKPEEQRAIAEMLSSLDGKIELLREQNKTLEATAQAIFKEWFVNFNFPGATGKMFDSELGKIPEGWVVAKLGDKFDITIGRTPPRLESEWFSNTPTGKKWISIKDIGNSEMYILNTSEYLTDEAIEKFNIPVIPENTTILSFKMTVGKLAITTEEMLSNEAIAHLKIKEGSNISTEFIFLFLKGLDFNSLGSTSSIVTAINSTMIKALNVFVPEDKIMSKFNAVIQPIFAKLKNNNFQIQTISILRDILLPKLMKGEVRVEGFNK